MCVCVWQDSDLRTHQKLQFCHFIIHFSLDLVLLAQTRLFALPKANDHVCTGFVCAHAASRIHVLSECS